MLDDVLGLLRRHGGVQPNRDASCSDDTEIRDRPVTARVCDNCDGLSPPESDLAKAEGKSVDELTEFRPCGGLPPSGGVTAGGRQVGPCFGASVHQPVEGAILEL